MSLGVGCGVSTVLMPTGRHTRRSWSCTRCLGTFTYSERDASIADRRESKPRRSRFIVESSVGVSRTASWGVTGGMVLSSWRRLSVGPRGSCHN